VAYNNIITRPDAQALVPEEVSRAMLKVAVADSAVLQMFRRVPVGRNQTRFPVLSALPIAYWVNGETGLKQTTEVNWANKYLNIEEAAAIMAIPDAVVADAEINIWDESEPYLREAFGRLVDASVFFGTNAPASFPTNILAAAVAAGNTFTEASTAAQGGFFGDYDAALALVEADGFDVSGVVAARTARAKFRAARDSQGRKLDENRISPDLKMIDGNPIAYPMRGLFPAGGGAGTNVRLFVGDWDQFVLGVRQDITMDIFREGVIQDNTGAIVFNLMQQDMTAVRLTFRLGWQVSNLINFDQPTEGSRYPVAVLKY
jgi:HK97 family phage major capsid protein